MSDELELIDGVKKIEASTAVQLETPKVLLDVDAVIACQWSGATGIELQNLKTATVTVGETPVYVQIDLAGVKHYIAVYPVAA